MHISNCVDNEVSMGNDVGNDVERLDGHEAMRSYKEVLLGERS